MGWNLILIKKQITKQENESEYWLVLIIRILVNDGKNTKVLKIDRDDH